METKFCVVRFCDYESKPNKYIYVPESWVKTRRASDNMVGVVYPDEDPGMTDNRVMNNEQPSESWEEHYCELLYTNREYGDAKLEAMHSNYTDKKENPAATIKGKRKSTNVPSFNAPPSKNKLIDKKLYINRIKGDHTITKYEQKLQKSTETTDLKNNDEFITFLEQLQTAVSNKLTELKTIKNTPKEQNTETPFLNRSKKGNDDVPPEFNENDTKWTLKYQNSGSGLQELTPGSGVYVIKDQAVHIAEAANYEELIQILMRNVFSENALAYCTLERTNRRLHQRAVSALLYYVISVGHVKRWDEVSIIELKHIMRQILQSKKNMSNKAGTKT